LTALKCLATGDSSLWYISFFALVRERKCMSGVEFPVKQNLWSIYSSAPCGYYYLGKSKKELKVRITEHKSRAPL
jgi:hypothetical protein